jgi:hypothetical protein
MSSAWWGTTDAYGDNANTLWAGIPFTAKKIGISSVGMGAGTALNTVLYYLDVPITQFMGAYSGSVTFTAVVNP